MIQALIIDDEKPARSRIRHFIEEMDEIEIIGEADNGEEGLALVEKLKPQLLFLDIQMPRLDGFGLLEKCSYRPAVIFISAYDEYALHAFEVNAVDYLLKPYSQERFASAVSRVLREFRSDEFWENKLNALLRTYRERDDVLDQISVKTGHSFKVYETRDIDFFRMDDGLLFLYAGGERAQIDTVLNQLETRLPPAQFFRVHRNSLVNLRKIREVIPWGQGRLVLDFGSSGKVHVSRERIRELKQKIGLKI